MNKPSNRNTSLLLCILIGSTSLISRAADGPDATSGKAARYATANELMAVGARALGRTNQVLFSPDGRLMWLGVLWQLEPWEQLEFGGPPLPGKAAWMGSFNFSPDGNKTATLGVVDGQPWIGLRDPLTPEGEMLVKLPKDMNLVRALFSPDGKGIFVHVAQELQRARQPPTADYPVTENLNVRLRVSPHYDETIPWRTLAKAYPEAEEAEMRDYIIYVDIETKAVRRVFTGNDINQLTLSPDGKHFLAVQTLLRWRRTDWPQTHSDAYVVPIPAVTDMPLIDLEKIKDEERNAGWFDHKQEQLKPVLADVGIPTYDLAVVFQYAESAIHAQWSPDGTKFAYGETGKSRAGDVWVYELASKQARNLTEQVDLAALTGRVHEPLGMQYGGKLLSPRFGSRQPPVWMADSRAVLVPARGYLWRLPTDGGPVENLSREAGPDGIVEVITGAKQEQPYETAPEEIVVRTTNMPSLCDGFARFNLRTKRLIPIFQGKGLVMGARIEEHSRKLYYYDVAPDDGGEIYVHDLKAGIPPRQLTQATATALTGLKVPEKMLLSYTTKGGRKSWARLHFPPGARKDVKWPMVVIPDGVMFKLGAWAHEYYYPGQPTLSALQIWRAFGLRAWGSQVQTFNRAGYAVLYIDVPLGEWGKFEEIRQAIADGYDTAADAAVATGRIDAGKIGLFGDDSNIREYSMAGLMTQTAISASDRYAAAVSVNGYGSLTGQALSAAGYRSIEGNDYWASKGVRERAPRMEKNYASDPARYERNSALPYFGQVKTPLLLMQSEEAMNVLAARGEESFSALLPTGTKTVVAFYNKGSGTTQDMYNRAVVWFNEHMRGGPKLSGHATIPESKVADRSEIPEPPEIMPDGSLMLQPGGN